jgi:hypothetical protein
VLSPDRRRKSSLEKWSATRNLLFLPVTGLLLLVCGLIFLAGPNTVHATVFTAVRSGNWNDPNTWGGTATPGPVDAVIVPSPLTVTIPFISQVDLTGGTLTVNSGGTLFVDTGAVIANNGGIINNGTITINSAGIITNSITNNHGGTITNLLGTITNNFGGTIASGGTITNDNGGTITNNEGATITNNFGAHIANLGTITNNYGANITNDGLMDNFGTITNYIGATFNNPGTGTISNECAGQLVGNGNVVGSFLNEILCVPSPQSPFDGSTSSTSTPTFTWQDNLELRTNVQYAWQIAKASDPNTPIQTAYGLSAISHTANPLSSGTYVWRVWAVGAIVPLGHNVIASDLSSPFTLTVVAPLTITAPPDIVVSTDPNVCSGVVSAAILGTATASGGIGPVTIVSNPPSGTAFPLGITTVM